MPKPVDIEIFCIGHTTVDREAVAQWLKFIDVENFEIPANVTEPALLIAIAAKRCYKSFEVSGNPNLTRVRSDYVEYLDNVMKSGHGSVTEHSSFSFAIENVSRVFTAEMNRHRAGWAISEGSLRYIRFGENIPYWVPTSIQGPDIVREWHDPLSLVEHLIDDERSIVEDRSAKMAAAMTELYDHFKKYEIGGDDEYADPIVMQSAIAGNQPFDPDWPHLIESEGRVPDVKKELSRQIFHAAFAYQEACYRLLEKIWAKELSPTSKFAAKKQVTSMMRRIIGLGVATGGVWTGNIRALRHVMAMRCSEHAEEEMLHVFSRIVKMMADREPMLFGDFYQDDQGFWRPKYHKI